MKHSMIAVVAMVVMACGVSSDTGINKSIYVGDGEHKANGLRSVNGTITVGNDAVVEGSCTTVNGKINIGENAEVGEVSCVNGGISLDRNATAEQISCVNGSIYLGGEVKVEGDVSTVNGSIKCKSEAQIAGNLETVNGDMETVTTLISGDITTVNGDVTLQESSLVKGDIIIRRNRKKPTRKEFRELIITIDSDSKVTGKIEVKGDEPNVTVVLSDGGEVLGDIINARVVRK